MKLFRGQKEEENSKAMQSTTPVGSFERLKGCFCMGPSRVVEEIINQPSYVNDESRISSAIGCGPLVLPVGERTNLDVSRKNFSIISQVAINNILDAFDEFIACLKDSPDDICQQSDSFACSTWRTEYTRVTAMFPPADLFHLIKHVDEWAYEFYKVIDSRILYPQSNSLLNFQNFMEGIEYIEEVTAEFYCPCPLVDSRRFTFLRVLKCINSNLWAIIEIDQHLLQSCSKEMKCRRRPSGFIVREEANGSSLQEITWIEHVQINDSEIESMYDRYVKSAMPFGAKRWIKALERAIQERNGPFTPRLSVEGEKAIRKFTKDMVTFSIQSACGTPSEDEWDPLHNIRAIELARKNIMVKILRRVPQHGSEVHLCASTSFFLQDSPSHVLSLLSRTNYPMWLTPPKRDKLLNRIVQSKMFGSSQQERSIGLFRAEEGYFLQETRYDDCYSYVIFNHMDSKCKKEILRGDYSSIPLLPKAFVVMPVTPEDSKFEASLVTFSMHRLSPNAKVCQAMNDLYQTVEDIITELEENVKA